MPDVCCPLRKNNPTHTSDSDRAIMSFTAILNNPPVSAMSGVLFSVRRDTHCLVPSGRIPLQSDKSDCLARTGPSLVPGASLTVHLLSVCHAEHRAVPSVRYRLTKRHMREHGRRPHSPVTVPIKPPFGPSIFINSCIARK